MAKRAFGRKHKTVEEVLYDGPIEYLSEHICTDSELENENVGMRIIEEVMASATPKKAVIKCMMDRIVIHKNKSIPSKKNKIELAYANLQDLRKINTTIGIRFSKVKTNQVVYEVFKFGNNKDTLNFLKIVIKEYKDANAAKAQPEPANSQASESHKENAGENEYQEANEQPHDEEDENPDQNLPSGNMPKEPNHIIEDEGKPVKSLSKIKVPSIVLSGPENEEEPPNEQTESRDEIPVYQGLMNQNSTETDSLARSEDRDSVKNVYNSQEYEWQPQVNKDFGIFFSDSDSDIITESEKNDVEDKKPVKKEKLPTAGGHTKNEDKQTTYYLKLIARRNEFPYQPKNPNAETEKVQNSWGQTRKMSKNDISDFYSTLINVRSEKARQALLQKHQEKQISQFRNIPVVGVSQNDLERFEPTDRSDVYKSLPNQQDDDFHRFPATGMEKVKINPKGYEPNFGDVMPDWLKNTIFKPNEQSSVTGTPTKPAVKIIRFEAEEYDEEDRLVTNNPELNKKKPPTKTVIDAILDLPLFSEDDKELAGAPNHKKTESQTDVQSKEHNEANKSSDASTAESGVDLLSDLNTNLKWPSWLVKLTGDVDNAD